MKELYTTEEVARASKLSEFTIRRHIKQGKLKAHKVGSEWRITKEDLEKYLKGE